ncbi:MAG: BTAD domain-containing putative transcriptional regulator [Gemmatimonadota bacterium]
MALLGGFRVWRGDDEVDALKSRPTCAALLSFVAVEGSVTRDQAVALLWPDSDRRRSRHALSQALYQLRRTLGSDWIVTRGQEIRLGSDLEVDTRRAEEAFAGGVYEEALRWLDGRFLQGWHLRATVPFQEWVEERERHYRALHRDASRRRIASCLDSGDVEGAIETARRWVRMEPSFEEATAGLVRALVAARRFQGALEAYEACARRLAEVGGVPGSELTTLLAAVKAGIQATRGEMMAPGPARRPEHRIVVLPFVHVGPPEHGHFTDGLSDDVTHRLSSRTDLAVIARSSALHVVREGRTLREIGQALEVDSILEGRVRRDEAAVRTRAEHVRVSDGERLWTVEIETGAEELATHAERIARRAAAALGLPPRNLDAREGAEGGRSPAYELCIRGLQHWHRRSGGELRDAIDLFVRAIEADPGFARSYGCLALAYAMVPSFTGASPRPWMPRARHVVSLGLDLDPDLVEGHMARGIIAWSFELDADAAGREYERVLAGEPSNAQARVWEAYRLAALGEREDALRFASEALDLDPLSISTNFDVGMVRWQAGDDTSALEQMRRVLAMDPGFTPAAFVVGAHHLRRRELERARREWSRISAFGPSWTSLLDALEERTRAVAAVDRIVELAPDPVHWYAVAVLYTLLGEPDRALRWLETHLRNLRGEPGGFRTGGPGLFLAMTDPFFEPIRPMARFQALVRALSLPRHRRPV